MTRHPRIVLRSGTPGDAPQIQALIEDNLNEGRLLPRELAEVAFHSARFVVAVHRRRLVGCGELNPLNRSVAEVRSLAVDRRDRGQDIGTQLVEELRTRAQLDAYSQLSAFTHAPEFFLKLGFLVVPHASVPEKFSMTRVGDSHSCAFGQFAMVMSLEPALAAMEYQTPAAICHV